MLLDHIKKPALGPINLKYLPLIHYSRRKNLSLVCKSDITQNYKLINLCLNKSDDIIKTAFLYCNSQEQAFIISCLVYLDRILLVKQLINIHKMDSLMSLTNAACLMITLTSKGPILHEIATEFKSAYLATFCRSRFTFGINYMLDICPEISAALPSLALLPDFSAALYLPAPSVAPSTESADTPQIVGAFDWPQFLDNLIMYGVGGALQQNLRALSHFLTFDVRQNYLSGLFTDLQKLRDACKRDSRGILLVEDIISMSNEFGFVVPQKYSNFTIWREKWICNKIYAKERIVKINRAMEKEAPDEARRKISIEAPGEARRKMEKVTKKWYFYKSVFAETKLSLDFQYSFNFSI